MYSGNKIIFMETKTVLKRCNNLPQTGMTAIYYRSVKSVESIALLIAARETGQENRLIENTKLQGSVSAQLNQFDNLRSISSIVCYLFSERYSDLTTWLDWEATQLRPYCEHYLVSSFAQTKADSKMAAKLRPALLRLDNILSKSDHILGGSKPSALDVICWSQLYPCLSKSSPAYVGNQFPNLSRWCVQLHQRNSFSTATADVLGTRDEWKVFKGLVSRLQLQALKETHVENTAETEETVKSSSKKAKVIGSGDEVISEEMNALLCVAVSEEEMKTAYEVFSFGSDTVTGMPPPQHPILPKEGERNLLITSALPYVNNVPHLGNIIGSVLSADVFVRYCRQRRGINPLYICGTDEYGTATETKAMAEGVTPREICDRYHVIHAAVYKWFNISFDYFGRTSTEKHSVISCDIFKRLHDRKCLIEEDVEQLHCGNCDKFLADRFVEGNCPFCNYEDARGDQCDKCGKLINATELKSPRCKICGAMPSIKTSRHLFLDLPKLQPSLELFLNESMKDDSLWTSNARHITRTWLRDGLKPRCITRDLKWGVSVPLAGFESKVFYVWFDAPIGYISITANYTDEWEKWWKNPQQVELVHFMAKDNVPFHSVIFPACLQATEDNYSLVKHLVSAEYLNYEDSKFSKSRGVGVFGDNAKSTGIPSDVWRFYLIYVRPETQDSTFSWTDLMWKNNSELLNNLGNFINRALNFLTKNFEGVIPAMDLSDDDKELLVRINRLLENYNADLTASRLRDGIPHILNISRLGNQYIQSNTPWVLVKKDEASKRRAGTVIGLSANISCLLGALLQPYLPETSATIQQQCNSPTVAQEITDQFVCFLKTGHRIGKPYPLFKKIELETIEDLKVQFSGKK